MKSLTSLLLTALTIIAFFFATGAFAEAVDELGGSDCSGLLAVTLTVTVYDDGVQPPFAHGQRLIEIVEAQNGAHITKRSGNRFEITTSDPTTFLRRLMEGPQAPAIAGLSLNGREFPLYDRARGIEMINANAQQFRVAFFKVLTVLPEGTYQLRDLANGEAATLFVSYRANRTYPGSTDTLALSVEIWPGDVQVPQFENKHKERMIAYFTNLSGVADGSSIQWAANSFDLSFSLPYGYGSDHLKFLISGPRPSRVLTNGHEYQIESHSAVIIR